MAEHPDNQLPLPSRLVGTLGAADLLTAGLLFRGGEYPLKNLCYPLISGGDLFGPV